MPTVRNRILLALVVALVPGCGGPPPIVASADVEALDIHLDAWGEEQKAAAVSTRDAGKIDALLAVLRTGGGASDHKCGDGGTITLRLRGGGETKIGILAGHDAGFYEFRVYPKTGSGYDLYRVKRGPFLEAMAGAGAVGLAQ
jgi:hypothetical protein